MNNIQLAILEWKGVSTYMVIRVDMVIEGDKIISWLFLWLKYLVYKPGWSEAD